MSRTIEGLSIDYLIENVQFINGVLDMLFHLADAGRMEQLANAGLATVILDAQTRAEDIMKALQKPT